MKNSYNSVRYYVPQQNALKEIDKKAFQQSPSVPLCLR